MNVKRLNMMKTMLNEVLNKTWKCSIDSTKPYYGTDTVFDSNIETEFNLENWVSKDYDCGFTACAVGHAILDKRFNDDGLKLSDRVQDGPIYDGFDGWCAVENYFGLECNEAEYLFSSDSYKLNTQEEIIKQLCLRIDYLVINGRFDFEIYDNEGYSFYNISESLEVIKQPIDPT